MRPAIRIAIVLPHLALAGSMLYSIGSTSPTNGCLLVYTSRNPATTSIPNTCPRREETPISNTANRPSPFRTVIVSAIQ
uniref:Putative secreted peptide n=1 Tax=Anopheles braziliensis TaxID=58242 RepID=A0A2M3ZM94_9DIPT